MNFYNPLSQASSSISDNNTTGNNFFNGVKRSFSNQEDKKNFYFDDLPLKKQLSNPEPENDEDSNKSDIFKIRWAINNLIQMGFDINICYHIIKNIEISNKEPEILFNEILDKYNKYMMDIENKEESYLNFFHQGFKREIKSINVSKNRHYDSLIIDMKPIEENSQVKENEMKVFEEKNLKICEICFEEKKLSEFYEIPGCKHTFCLSCLVSYLKEKVNSSELLAIPCPNKCGYNLEDVEIENIGKNEDGLFQKYVKFKKIMLMNADPNIRWCIRLNCNNIIKCKGNENKIECDICRQEICFKCRLAWHQRLTCVQALDNEFKIYSKNVLVKFCPKCQSRIEKNGGCNHMHCTRCNYDFCWICRRKYTNPNHYVWYNIFGCPKMQYQQFGTKTNMMFQCIKCFLQILAIIFIIPLSVLALCLLIILIILGASVTLPYLYCVYYEPKTKKQIALGVIIGIIGLILLPLVLIGIIFPGTCVAYKEYQKRKNR